MYTPFYGRFNIFPLKIFQPKGIVTAGYTGPYLTWGCAMHIIHVEYTYVIISLVSYDLRCNAVALVNSCRRMTFSSQ